MGGVTGPGGQPAGSRQVSDCHVVIRACGERTEALCRSLVATQLQSTGQLTVVRQVPFEAALRQSYEVGLGAGARWTITIDADLMLMPQSLPRLIDLAEAASSRTFMVQGAVFDHTSGQYRPAGPRIYRTAMLSAALPLIAADGQEIRPEYAVLTAMAQNGYASRHVADCLAIHDAEQFYADLYRKAFVHGRKHRHWLGMFLERAVARQDDDPDFRVILRGLWDSAMIRAPVSIDKRLFADWSAAALADLGLTEKPVMTAAEIQAAQQPGAIERYLEGPLPEPSPQGLSARLRRIFAREGMIRGAGVVAGRLLEEAGRALERRARRSR